MLDITAPIRVEIQIRNDGKVIWVHIEKEGQTEVTVFRACRIGELIISDERIPNAI